MEESLELALTPEQEQFILGGAETLTDTLHEERKEKKHRVLLEIPDWIFQSMELQLKSRRRKMPRVQWIINAIMKQLRLKDE